MAHVRFGEEIISCEFIDGQWQIRTGIGQTDQADVIIAATGVLHHPNQPDLPGLNSFRGASFHSAQWDHEVPLDGKRVGVIGTGSTAIQITTALVDRVARYKLFQRTAQWVYKAENKSYSADERVGLAQDPDKMKALRAELSAFIDIFGVAVIDAESAQMREIEAACLANLEETVVDPVLREKLRPNYRAACKRLIISPNFYESIQHPNAELVESGIEAIEPDGVRTKDGILHELDVLVLATGFRADRFIRPAVVRGRGGVDLDRVWEDHPVAYLSIVSGTPASMSDSVERQTDAIDVRIRWTTAPRKPSGERRGTPRPRDHRRQGALGEQAVADLTSFGAADPARLAVGRRRHVVVVHVALLVVDTDGVEQLVRARQHRAW